MSTSVWSIRFFLLAVLLAGCRGVQTLIPGEEAYFRDDFSDPASGWDRADGADGVTDYSGGAYRIFSALPDYYLWANPGREFVKDVRVEVDAIKSAGPDDSVFGVICRYRDVENFYVFLISGEGQGGIAKVQSGVGPILLSGESLAPDEHIHAGLGTNHLRADCAGDSLALYVNDHLIASADDDSLQGGDAGLWLGAFDMPGADVYFDNFIVRKP